MDRIARDFATLDEATRDFVLDNTWCDSCGRADLGLENPSLYEEAGRLFVAGACRRCGSTVRSEIVETIADE